MTQLYTISIITIILTDATNIYHAHNPSAMPASPHTPSYLHHLHYLHHLVNVLYHIKLPLVDHHSNPHYHSSTTPTKLTCPINSKAHSMVSTPSCWQPKPHSSMSKIYYNSLYFHLLSIISSAFGSQPLFTTSSPSRPVSSNKYCCSCGKPIVSLPYLSLVSKMPAFLNLIISHPLWIMAMSLSPMISFSLPLTPSACSSL